MDNILITFSVKYKSMTFKPNFAAHAMSFKIEMPQRVLASNASKNMAQRNFAERKKMFPLSKKGFFALDASITLR